MDLSLQNVPVVIDNGSGLLKAGFAGDQTPKCVCPAYVGRVKHERVMAGGSIEGDVFMGPKATEHRGLLKIRYPIEHGIVEDWNDMEKLWQYVYSKEQLATAAEEHPVLLTEAPLNPRQNREKAAEIFFEALHVPALFVSMQAVLSLYASGKTTGVVLDCGDGVSHAVPVYEGFAISHSISRIDVGGRDVTRYLQLLLRREGHIFKTSAEFETVRTIKERACYVAARSSARSTDKEIKPESQYVLPDGREISLQTCRVKAPEILFDPSLIGEECEGVHRLLYKSIHKSDMDLRKSLYSGIVLSGGSTLFKGFGERLLYELKKEAPNEVKIKINAPPERKYSTWVGGSILASLDTFQKMWVSKKEYDETGASVIATKIPF
jgi:centractin